MADFIHYTQRFVSTPRRATERDLWYAQQQAKDAGFFAPKYHVTRGRVGPAARVRPGDTIWLMSRLRSRRHGTGPMALDARIIVRRVKTRPEDAPGMWHFQYDAARGSRWFPLFASNEVLSELRAVTASGHGDKPLLSRNDGDPAAALRAMREVADAGPLKALEAMIDAAPLHFVSYRLADGTWPAFAQVQALCTQPVAIWWDRWCLPRRMAERREELSDARLADAMRKTIDRADVVWGIETPLYAEVPSYSAVEKARAVALGTYRGLTPAVQWC